MKLIEKANRDIIGIDTFERAIIFAVLMLRQGMRSDPEIATNQAIIFQSFGQENNQKVFNLTIDVKIPYDSALFCGLGGDFLSSINQLDDGTIAPEYDGEALSPTINNQGLIEDDPDDIYSLEQYLIWAMSRWIYYHKQQFPDNWDSYGYLSFLEEANPPVISAKVILFFDYEKYLETNNLIQAVRRKITTNVTREATGLLSNDALFGNDFILQN